MQGNFRTKYLKEIALPDIFESEVNFSFVLFRVGFGRGTVRACREALVTNLVFIEEVAITNGDYIPELFICFCLIEAERLRGKNQNGGKLEIMRAVAR